MRPHPFVRRLKEKACGIFTRSLFAAACAAAQSAAGAPPAADYELLFADEFSGDRVSEQDWNFRTGLRTGTGINGLNLAANVAVNGGHLAITARQETVNNAAADQRGQGETRNSHTRIWVGRGVAIVLSICADGARQDQGVFLSDGRDGPAGPINVVARRLRLAYEGAIYHVINLARIRQTKTVTCFALTPLAWCLQNRLLRLSGRQHVEHILDANAHPPEARPAAARAQPCVNFFTCFAMTAIARSGQSERVRFRKVISAFATTDSALGRFGITR